MSVGVEIIETPSLGNRGYLAHDGHAAVVVDPQRDIDRVLALAGRLGVQITHVAETHLHNDYVSGGLALARVTGAQYLVAGADSVSFERLPVADGDIVAVSEHLRLEVVATPGHTMHHMSYVVHNRQGPAGVFTGGSLLFGTTGRTDLLGERHMHALAERQHASVRRLADLLPDGTQVWPTHGFGSFCSATQSDASASTIGREREVNPALRLEADDFVTQTLAGLDAYPAYYARMGARNTNGAEVIDLRPVRRVEPNELRRRITDGEWVVDLRSRKVFSHRHLVGTLSFGLDGAMATWLGWLAPEGAPIILLGDSDEQIADAQRELTRIGIDRPAGAAVGTVDQWSAGNPSQVGQLPTATFVDLAAAKRAAVTRGAASHDVVLDVRLVNEWHAGHVTGAVHIALPDLPRRLHELPEGIVWVYCRSGYRASTAASLLQRAGRQAVHIDDDFAAAAAAGLAIAAPAPD